MRTQFDGDDSKDETGAASEQADLDECGDTTNAEDQDGPEEVELLFNLKRPEMLDVERVQIEGTGFPESQVGGVGEVQILPARPDEMKWAGEQENQD